MGKDPRFAKPRSMGYPHGVDASGANAEHEERSFDSLSDPDRVAHTTLDQDDSGNNGKQKLPG